MKRHLILVLTLTVLLQAGYAQNREQALNGDWLFALDPLKVGEQDGWTSTGFPDNKLDKVTIPHSFSVDKRYFFYTGTAWYFKKFNAPPVTGNNKAFIKFEAVFYKCTIWLNGQRVAAHEGGYTPFEVEITRYIKQHNVLTVMADNSWDTTTIPGARTRDSAYNAGAAQVYPWINYGGITKEVKLYIKPPVRFTQVKIEATPDNGKNNARVKLGITVQNLGASDTVITLKAAIYRHGAKLPEVFKPTLIRVSPYSQKKLVLQGTLKADNVQLWDIDHPNLYTLQAQLGADTLVSNFGIRKIEIRKGQLLLNGQPIKLGGGNRPADYPGLGSLDPDSALQKDLLLMKSAGMELSRIAHHAVSERLLDWADEHGMLIITEAGNWQLSPKQMADTLIRSKYELQMKEMAGRDWNHPSVIAYSLGNEFYAHRNEGQAWVRDMSAFVKSLDSTRLITFASNTVFRDYVKKPEDEASQYVDFISVNLYANHLKWLQHTHELYPDKPIYVSEFGIMLTPGKTEQDRVAYLESAIEVFRKLDYVVGASIWSFNDYLSRFPGSGANGYRSWGVVTPDRKPRSAYYTLQQEFCPAVVQIVGRNADQLIVKVTARNDFPAYRLQGYQLRAGGVTVPLKTLQPGNSQQISLSLPAGKQSSFLELIKPGGIVIYKQSI
jgi:beta-glucuronidase